MLYKLVNNTVIGETVMTTNHSSTERIRMSAAKYLFLSQKADSNCTATTSPWFFSVSEERCPLLGKEGSTGFTLIKQDNHPRNPMQLESYHVIKRCESS